MGEITREEIRERLGNIDQIRDIIFGAHLREYNSRLDKVESDIATVQAETRDRINELKDTLTIELRAAVESIDKRLKALSSAAQEETTDLRQQLDRINRKFTNSIETLDEALEEQKNSLRDELSQTRDKLQEDVRDLRAHIFEELERHFSMLREVKVSKDDMAELLFELGMRLKGSEFVPELREAAEIELDEKYDDLALPQAEPKRSAEAASTGTTATSSSTTRVSSRSKTTKA
jgi:uncharacterized phage infection (PIP) family protein YhgE